MEEEGDTTGGRNERQRTSDSNEKQKFGWGIRYKYVQIIHCGAVRSSCNGSSPPLPGSLQLHHNSNDFHFHFASEEGSKNSVYLCMYE